MSFSPPFYFTHLIAVLQASVDSDVLMHSASSSERNSRQHNRKATENISPTKGSRRTRSCLSSVAKTDLFDSPMTTIDSSLVSSHSSQATVGSGPALDGDGDDLGPAPLQLQLNADEDFQGAVVLNNKSNSLGTNAHMAQRQLLDIVKGFEESNDGQGSTAGSHVDTGNLECVGDTVTLNQNEVLPTGTFVNMGKEPHAWALVGYSQLNVVSCQYSMNFFSNFFSVNRPFPPYSFHLIRRLTDNISGQYFMTTRVSSKYARTLLPFANGQSG